MKLIKASFQKVENIADYGEKKLGGDTASVIYIFLALFTLFFMMAWSKVHINEVPPLQSQYWRGLLTSIMIFIYSTFKNIPLTVSSKSQDKLRILRNLISSLFNVLMFFIVTKLPITTVWMIQTSSPFMIACIDHIFYKTAYTKIETIFSFVSMFGVLILIKPDLFFNVEESYLKQGGYVEGLEKIFWITIWIVAVLFWSGSVVMLKALKSMNSMALNFPFGLFMAASSAFLEVEYEQLKSPSVWLYVQAAFFLGAFGFINQSTYIRANQIGKPGKVAIINNLNVVLGFLFEIFYLHEKRESYSFIGAVLIVGSSVMLSVSRLR